MPYAGLIEVEEGNFDLQADIFIIRDNEYSFVFSGSDESGSFRIEGIAKQSDAGFYMAPQLELQYPGYAGADTASIRIDNADINEGDCQIRGVWIQNGDSFNFFGNLKPHSPDNPA